MHSDDNEPYLIELLISGIGHHKNCNDGFTMDKFRNVILRKAVYNKINCSRQNVLFNLDNIRYIT